MTPSAADYSAVVQSPPDTVDDAHDFLQRVWAERSDLTAAERVVFETVLSELVTNVIQNNPQRPVLCRVNLRVGPEELVLETTDTGAELEVVPDRSMPADDAEHGRGLALIELMVDRLDYTRRDGQNIWTATKSRVAAA